MANTSGSSVLLECFRILASVIKNNAFHNRRSKSVCGKEVDKVQVKAGNTQSRISIRAHLRRAVIVAVTGLAAGCTISILIAWSLAYKGQERYRDPGFCISSTTVASDEYIPFLLTVESHGLPFPCLTHSERSPSFIIFPAYEVFHNKDSGIVGPVNAFAIRNNN